jgi:hypothetical protein
MEAHWRARKHPSETGSWCRRRIVASLPARVIMQEVAAVLGAAVQAAEFAKNECLSLIRCRISRYCRLGR